MASGCGAAQGAPCPLGPLPAHVQEPLKGSGVGYVVRKWNLHLAWRALSVGEFVHVADEGNC